METWNCEACGEKNPLLTPRCSRCHAGVRPLQVRLQFPSGGEVVIRPGGDGVVGRNTLPGVTDTIDMSRQQLRLYRTVRDGAPGWYVANLSHRVPVVVGGRSVAAGGSESLPEGREITVQVASSTLRCIAF